MTESEFRAAYPAFADATTFPSGAVSFWLEKAAAFVDPSRWGDMADVGIGLYAAHWLTFGKVTADAAASGSIAGGAAGILTSKSVGGVSFGYDARLVASPDAGAWNATAYGRQFWDLARLFGAGGLQL